MKKSILAIAATIAVFITSCGGHSQASREQISNAHERAAVMLKNVHEGTTRTTPVADTSTATDTLANDAN